MLAAALAAGSFARADDQKPMRHLVFDFGVTLQKTSTVHTSGIGDGEPASGSVDYKASNTDTGTIVADVVAVQTDTGLVVRISEQGRGTRNSEPTMCVTYGTGSVICDMTRGGPNEEEMSLLRVLGRDFVNPALLDQKNHWRTSSEGAGGKETNDYTIVNTAGDVANIVFQRVLEVDGAQAFTASTQGHIAYNEKMSVPTHMTEDTITRRNTGEGNYDTITQNMTFTLSSDSLAQTSH
jgi:hypothetical protein